MNARQFAEKAHGDQKYGDRPYVAHLDEVVQVLHEFGLAIPEYIIAAYLHDILEDTDLKYEYIQREYGRIIAEMVYAVTDDPGTNRRERKRVTYMKLRQWRNAIVLKLADRIANARAVISENKTELYKMYHEEYREFKDRLYFSDMPELGPMWIELDKLMGVR